MVFQKKNSVLKPKLKWSASVFFSCKTLRKLCRVGQKYSAPQQFLKKTLFKLELKVLTTEIKIETDISLIAFPWYNKIKILKLPNATLVIRLLTGQFRTCLLIFFVSYFVKWSLEKLKKIIKNFSPNPLPWRAYLSAEMRSETKTLKKRKIALYLVKNNIENGLRKIIIRKTTDLT